ncbi:hypothetical protein [Planomonospora sphaerica]|uniref:hypothetical protein n=1 Tax=Planomonospora sphaerica TaxID=161355 RepID=UPI0012905A58|nr:hypothetical protein [Planomonospora sphaerica]
MADHYRTELITDAIWMATGTGLLQPGAVFHSDRGSNGGFNWSSQHLDRGGVNGQASGLDEGVDRQGADEVSGGAVVAAGDRARVLA